MIRFQNLVLLLACTVALAAIALVGCGEPQLHKSDQTLEEAFSRSAESFSRLVSMADHDKFHILWLKTREMEPSDTNLSTGRWDEYLALCKPLGLTKIERLPDRVIFVSSTESQAFGHGLRKGYVYSQKPLSPLVPTLDSGVPREYVNDSKGTAYKTLAADWYLFAQQD